MSRVITAVFIRVALNNAITITQLTNERVACGALVYNNDCNKVRNKTIGGSFDMCTDNCV